MALSGNSDECSEGRSLRICLLLYSSGEGGLEKHVIELAEGLAERGHQVLLLADEWMRARLDARVRFSKVDARKGRLNPVLLWQTYCAIKEFSPDILHAHARKAIQISLRLKRFLGCRVVGSIHNNRPRRGDRLRGLDRLICVSRGVKTGLGIGDAQVIYNGVAVVDADVDSEIIDVWGALKGACKVLSVGRLARDKGFDVLLKAVAQLDDVSLCIAGEGSERITLERLITEMGLSNRVRLLGHRNDISGLMHKADMLVVSSRNEGFSYAFAEAMLSELPVVSTNVPIANELLPDELICRIADVRDLADKIDKVRSASKQQLAIWYQPLYEYAAGQLSMSAMLDRVEAVYFGLQLDS